MALDNTLICSTNASNDQICEAVARYCGTIPLMEDGNLRYRVPGLWGTVMPASDLSKELTNETFGFIPTKEFLFRLDKFAEFQEGLDTMIKLCIIVIRDLAGDCVFLTEDVTILLRKNNQLILRSSEDDPNRKKLLIAIAEGVGGPSSFGELPEI
jgi:hypothetical protein